MGVRNTAEYFASGSSSSSGSKSSSNTVSNAPAASGSGSASAPIAGSSAFALSPGISSYSAVGIGDASTINNLTDMTILENAFLAYIRGQRKPAIPPSTPPDSNEKAIIAMARSTNKTVSTKIASGDTSIANANELVIEEINAILAIRGKMDDSDLTKEEKNMLVKMRKDFAASTASRYSGSSGSGSGSSGSAIQRDASLQEATDADKSADLNSYILGAASSTPKFSKIMEEENSHDLVIPAAGGLIQDQRRHKMKLPTPQFTADPEYDPYDPYDPERSRYRRRQPRNRDRRPSTDPEEGLLQEQIDLLAMQQVRMERQMQQSCPDMSKYIKMDEVPCYNCTLP
jgi:hypothetical protein